jgi:hypothetical protein
VNAARSACTRGRHAGHGAQVSHVLPVSDDAVADRVGRLKHVSSRRALVTNHDFLRAQALPISARLRHARATPQSPHGPSAAHFGSSPRSAEWVGRLLRGRCAPGSCRPQSRTLQTAKTVHRGRGAATGGSGRSVHTPVPLSHTTGGLFMGAGATGESRRRKRSGAGQARRRLRRAGGLTRYASEPGGEDLGPSVLGSAKGPLWARFLPFTRRAVLAASGAGW